MTSEEIKKVPDRHRVRYSLKPSDDEISPQVEHVMWLKEIAYQLAVMNERAERTTPDNSSPEVLFVANLTSN